MLFSTVNILPLGLGPTQEDSTVPASLSITIYSQEFKRVLESSCLLYITTLFSSSCSTELKEESIFLPYQDHFWRHRLSPTSCKNREMPPPLTSNYHFGLFRLEHVNGCISKSRSKYLERVFLECYHMEHHPECTRSVVYVW